MIETYSQDPVVLYFTAMEFTTLISWQGRHFPPTSLTMAAQAIIWALKGIVEG